MLMCMCMLNRRVHTLFDKDLWNRLTKIAKSQNISFGALIRQAVTEYLDNKKELISEDKQAPFKGFFKRKG